MRRLFSWKDGDGSVMDLVRAIFIESAIGNGYRAMWTKRMLAVLVSYVSPDPQLSQRVRWDVSDLYNKYDFLDRNDVKSGRERHQYWLKPDVDISKVVLSDGARATAKLLLEADARGDINYSASASQRSFKFGDAATKCARGADDPPGINDDDWTPGAGLVDDDDDYADADVGLGECDDDIDSYDDSDSDADDEDEVLWSEACKQARVAQRKST